MEIRQTVNNLTEACIELRTRLDKCDRFKERAALVMNHLEKYARSDARIADFPAGVDVVGMSVHNRQPATAEARPSSEEQPASRLTAKDHVQRYTELIKYESQLDEELLELKSHEQAAPSEQAVMNLLHRYNDIRDCLEWLNVSESLSLKRQLTRKLVILDFFTYCCINCMHVLPDLFELEAKFSVEDGLAVIGVHSAKFANEREQNRLISAVQRYRINHPVVNDSSLSHWRATGVVCWPTLLMIGPAAQPLAVFVGEGHKEELFLYTELALKYFKSRNAISDHSLPLSPTRQLLPRESERLRFPGKLAVSCRDASTEILVISDSGNNRILLVEGTGLVRDVVGGSEPAFGDGGFADARFSAPQGICTLRDKVYVADTGNHAIRMIDLDQRTVITVAGTGSQGHDYVGGRMGRDQPISSPWDVCVYHHRESTSNQLVPVLFIAMAGTHQIWALFLQDTIWWKNKKYKAGACAAIVGSGKEENRNNAYPHAAGLAQPSGLAIDQDGKSLFFADSESSAIRKIDLQSGRVVGISGGSRNPADLHDYGDVDGSGNAAKLQHPLGLAWHAAEKFLYVADTYNHKLKLVRVNGACRTFCGSGKPDPSFLFDEPSGLALSGNGILLYVADTNNHAIKVIRLSDNTISKLPIEFPDEKSLPPAEPHFDQTYQLDTLISSDGGELVLRLCLAFEGELKLNKESRQNWRVLLPLAGSGYRVRATAGELSTPISLEFSPGTGTHEVCLVLDIVACSGTKCIPKVLSLLYMVHQRAGASRSVVERRKLVVKE